MKKFILSLISAVLLGATSVGAQKVERIAFGDFDNWVTRNIKESHIIGGHERQVYEIGPTQTINGDKPYVNLGGSPWATSNVMAKVCGITKTSNAVFPDERSQGNRCARLTTMIENCKAIGIINIDVVVAGSIFLGKMLEPIKSTKEPYSKMEMGVPFSKRPKALVFDYKLYIPENGDRLYSSGFGSKKTYKGSDKAEVFILLQRRWEDADGKLYAKRVGTGRIRLDKSSNGWVNGHRLNVQYGDITGTPGYKPYMGLIPENHNYYARNSKGENVEVHEIGWDDANATPTHMLVMFSSGSGDAYIGTVGTNFWVDNVGLEY